MLVLGYIVRPAPALQQTLLQLLTRACFSSLLDLEGLLEVRQVERGCSKLTRAHQKYEKRLWRGIILAQIALMSGSGTAAGEDWTFG